MCLHNGGTFQITFDDLRFEHNTIFSTSSLRFLQCVTGLTPYHGHLSQQHLHTAGPISSSGAFTHTNNLYSMTNGASVGYSLGSGEKARSCQASWMPQHATCG
jgi:hypothetical protein